MWPAHVFVYLYLLFLPYPFCSVFSMCTVWCTSNYFLLLDVLLLLLSWMRHASHCHPLNCIFSSILLLYTSILLFVYIFIYFCIAFCSYFYFYTYSDKNANITGKGKGDILSYDLRGSQIFPNNYVLHILITATWKFYIRNVVQAKNIFNCLYSTKHSKYIYFYFFITLGCCVKLNNYRMCKSK